MQDPLSSSIYVEFHIHTTARETGKLNTVISLHQVTNTLKHKDHVNNIYKFSSYSTENTPLVYYKDQPFRGIYENNHCLF
jgi:hypothetical protein